MTLRKNIKRQSRQALQGSWGQARLILIILLGLGFCINALDASAMSLMGYSFEFSSLDHFVYSSNFFYEPIAILLSGAIWLVRLVIVAPLGVGMLGWYLDLTDRRRQGVSYIFWPYENRAWLRAAWVRIGVAVRVTLFSIPVLAVPLGIIGFSNYLYYPHAGSPYLGLLGLLLLLPAGAVVAVFSKRYALAPMLLTERYAMTTREAIRSSVRCTRGHCTELFLLDLSFLPWLLPCMAICGLLFGSMYNPFSLFPALLVGVLLLAVLVTIFKLQPYYTMTTLMYTRYLYEYAQWQGESATQASPQEHTEPAQVVWEPVDREPVQAPPPSPPADRGVVWRDITDE